MSAKDRVRSPVLILVVGIPLLSVALGAVILYLANTGNASAPLLEQMESGQKPLSKTSWRGSEQP